MLLGPPQIYEVRLPVSIGDRPFGTVQVGVSTSLVRQTLRDALLRSLAFGAGALGLAIALGLGTGRVLLGYLRRIARRVERLARGDAAGRARARRRHGTARRAHAGPRRAHPGHRGAGGRLGPGRGRAAPERGSPPLAGRHHGVRQRDRRAAARPDARGPLPRRSPAVRTPAGPAGRGPSRPEGFTRSTRRSPCRAARESRTSGRSRDILSVRTASRAAACSSCATSSQPGPWSRS